jgi:hypothetical protein
MMNLSNAESLTHRNYQILKLSDTEQYPPPPANPAWSEVYLYIFKSIKTFLLYVRNFVAVVTL